MGLVDFLFRREKKRQLEKLKAKAAQINALEEKYAAMERRRTESSDRNFQRRIF